MQPSAKNHSKPSLGPEPKLDADLLDGRPCDATSARELVRLLRHLRDDIKRSGATLNLPSGWVIRSLVHNYRGASFHPNDWLKDLSRVLNVFKEQLSLDKKGMTQFYEMNTVKPLFPNSEGFTRTDLLKFISRIQLYLKNIEGNE